MPAPSLLQRLFRSPKIAGGLAVGLVVLTALVIAGAADARRSPHAAGQRGTALKLATSGASAGTTVTAGVAPSPAAGTPSPSPPPAVPRVSVTANVGITVTLGSKPKPDHSTPPQPVYPANPTAPPGITFVAGGLFVVLPLNNVQPVLVAASDPAVVTCTPTQMHVAPGAEGTVPCTITSQNGFSGTLSVSCDHLVGQAPDLDIQAQSGCSTPATVDLPAGGSVSTEVTFDMPASAIYSDYFFIRLLSAGKQLQAPNQIEAIIDLPPQPPPIVKVACAPVTTTVISGSLWLVGRCDIDATETALSPYNPGLGIIGVSSPSGATVPGFDLQRTCWEPSAAEVEQQTAIGCPQNGDTMDYRDADPGTNWFAISTAGLPPGTWQLTIEAEEGPTTVTTTVSITVGPDGSVTGL